MNLALAIGCTVEEIEQRMTEREFGLWRRYVAHFGGLPMRRLEMHCAQIAFMVGRSGDILRRGIGLKDLFLDPPAAEPTVDAGLGAAVIRSMTSSRVRVLGQGRKKAVQ